MKKTNHVSSTPRILFFDVETAPNLGFTWGKWEQNVIENQRDWYMLSFAYKWLGEKNVKAHSLPEFKGYSKNKEDDTMLMMKLWALFDEADIIVAHNGDSFDIKKSNARFLIHGMKPPKPYKTIDTKKVAKRFFKFDSNSLNDLGKHLGVGVKMDVGGFETWKGCMTGKQSSWDRMVKYNKMDVVLLENVYLKLRPWITNFPVVYVNNGTCRNCGGIHFQKRGYKATAAKKYQQLQCKNCNAWSYSEIIQE